MKLRIENGNTSAWQYDPRAGGRPARFYAQIASEATGAWASPELMVDGRLRPYTEYTLIQRGATVLVTRSATEAEQTQARLRAALTKTGDLSALRHLVEIRSKNILVPDDGFVVRPYGTPDETIWLDPLDGKPEDGCLILTAFKGSIDPCPRPAFTKCAILRNGFVASDQVRGCSGMAQLYDLATAAILRPGETLGYLGRSAAVLWAFGQDGLTFCEGADEVQAAFRRCTGMTVQQWKQVTAA